MDHILLTAFCAVLRQPDGPQIAGEIAVKSVFDGAEAQITECSGNGELFPVPGQLHMAGGIHPHLGLEVRLAIDRQAHLRRFLKCPAVCDLHDDGAVPALPRSYEEGLILGRIKRAGAVPHIVLAGGRSTKQSEGVRSHRLHGAVFHFLCQQENLLTGEINHKGVGAWAEDQRAKRLRRQDVLVILRQLDISGSMDPDLRLKGGFSVDRCLHAGPLAGTLPLDLQHHGAVRIPPSAREGGLVLRRIHHAGAVCHTVRRF